jgi:hypothetical protein
VPANAAEEVADPAGFSNQSAMTVDLWSSSHAQDLLSAAGPPAKEFSSTPTAGEVVFISTAIFSVAGRKTP